LEHTLDLIDKVPNNCCVVSESGIRNHSNLQKLESAGVKAVLVGESLLRASDIGAKLDELRGLRK
jgi:indole-3-glycerol phosphate synthase